MRPWGGQRYVSLRNPQAPGWPVSGERTLDRGVAEKWAERLMAYHLEQTTDRQLGIVRRPRTLGIACEAYEAERAPLIAENTLLGLRSALGHVKRAFGQDTPTERITKGKMQRMFTDLSRAGYRPSSVRTIYMNVRGLWAWLGGTSPLEGVALPDLVQEDTRAWTDREIELLRSAADELGCRVILEMALATGCRELELFALQWEDFDPETHTVRVHHQRGRQGRDMKPLKGKKPRTTLVLPDWWRHYQGGTGFIAPVLYRRHRRELVDRLIARAGLTEMGVGWHRFRHTYARLFLEMGGSMEQLQKSLGHASIRTTERTYAHFSHDTAARLARERIYKT